jgi:AI-2 transport protein TqsA
MVPFFLVVFITIVCTPPLFWLQRKGVPKVFAIVIMPAVILLAGILFAAWIGPPLSDFLKSLPDYQENQRP